MDGSAGGKFVEGKPFSLARAPLRATSRVARSSLPTPESTHGVGPGRLGW